MKRAVLPILLLVVAFFLAQCASTEERSMPAAQTAAFGGSPVAEFPETDHDLGKIDDGQEYSYVFRVRNTGAGTLEIKKVLPG